MNVTEFFVRIETLGCRLNQTESEGLAFIFNSLGFSIFTKHKLESQSQPVDAQKITIRNVFLCIVNTCTVTSKAEQKARRLIRYLAKAHPMSAILVTGCYAQLEKNIIEALDERVITFAGDKKDSLSLLPKYIKDRLGNGISLVNWVLVKNIVMSFRDSYESIVTTHFLPKHPMFALSAPTFMFHSRATLKVEDGCNNACTFCRIRLARGKAVSLPIDEVIKRAKEIEKMGSSEVVITGVNLYQYKSDSYDFAGLLAKLIENTSHIRVRISSLYPESITSTLLPIISNDRIVPHFHLSIQSGCDEILRKMGRLYKRSDIYRAVNLIREAKAKPFIGCDIITGFPSETDEFFLQTESMCKELKFTGIHAFPFSARPGTKAFDMKPKISERLACQRVEVLNLIAKQNYREYLSLCEGDKVFAIVETSSDSSLFVTTENYLHLPFVANKEHKPSDAVFVAILNGFAVEC